MCLLIDLCASEAHVRSGVGINKNLLRHDDDKIRYLSEHRFVPCCNSLFSYAFMQIANLGDDLGEGVSLESRLISRQVLSLYSLV